MIERTEPIWQKLGNGRIRLDILDYPGEWLLDLPLLKKTYVEWSNETLKLLKCPPRASVSQDFFNFLEGF